LIRESVSSSPAVRCSALTKDYGSGHGVFDLDLTVEVGEVFGFLGPNGAGKTTTIRLIMDLISADRGTASVFDLDCRADSLAVKRLVGYLGGRGIPSRGAGGVILVVGLVEVVDQISEIATDESVVDELENLTQPWLTCSQVCSTIAQRRRA
jgi:ABC-2 type transport system ATP-binding protein